jgi:hypothetical protein
MQYKIWDQSAIAFSQSFYKALAAGLPLDQAVSLARIAVFNLCDSIKDELQRQSFWRDWGVPVLYCRTKENFVLPAIKDEEQRQDLLNELTNVQKNPKFLQVGKYNINMEKAEGIAIGDGAQVIKTEMRGNGNKQKDDQSGWW